MKKIFIVGGNGFSRECANYILSLNKDGLDIELGGFLGHGGYGHTVDYKTWQPLYKGEVCDYNFSEEDYCIIGAGYPKLREKIYNDLKALNVKLYNLVFNSSYWGTNIELGEGNIILTSSLTDAIKVGNGNLLNRDVMLGHDCEIGDFNFLGPRTLVLGEVKIGNSNTIGTNSVLLPNSKIGNNNKIAPLSAVYKGCKNNGYYNGNPALKVGDTE